MADGSNRIPVWYYDKTRNYWTAKDSRMFHPRKPFSSQSLRIITYNILFKHTDQPSRFNHLNALLHRSDAHIISLQETTKYVLEELLSQRWIQDRYILSDVDGRTFLYSPDSYGLVMLIDKHLDLQELSMFPLPTQKGRQFLLAQIQLRNERFLVGTTHLESLRNSQALRSQQLQLCQSVFDRYLDNGSNVTGLFMGDFNFGAHWSENAVQMNILKGWSDLWPSLRGLDDWGITHTNVRFDRLMFRSSHLIPINIRIIGKKPIQEEDTIDGDQPRSEKDIFISDHYGLIATFDLNSI